MYSLSLKNKDQPVFKKLLKVFIFTFAISNAAADEEIIIIGDPINPPMPSPIYIPPGGGGGGGGDGGGGGGGGGEPEDPEKPMTKAECTLQATKSFNACNNIANAGAVVGAGYCAVMAPSGPFAAACLFVVGGATAVNLSQCADMKAEMDYVCDSMP